MRIVIPTHGRAELLLDTIESISRCEIPAGFLETFIIENGGQCGARDAACKASSQFPHLNIRYEYVPLANKSSALNHILDSISTGCVVFLDDDIRVQPQLLVAYREAAQAAGPGHYFGGPFGVRYEDRPADYLITALPLSARGCDEMSLRSGGFAYGFNWAAFAEDLKKAGGFDPAYGPGSQRSATGQETDMQRRLKEIGCLMVIVPRAEVEHFVPRARSSPKWILRRRFRLGVASGQSISAGSRENTLLRESATALRSLVLLPILLLSKGRQYCFGHVLNLARAAGLIYGYSASYVQRPRG